MKTPNLNFIFQSHKANEEQIINYIKKRKAYLREQNLPIKNLKYDFNIDPNAEYQFYTSESEIFKQIKHAKKMERIKIKRHNEWIKEQAKLKREEKRAEERAKAKFAKIKDFKERQQAEQIENVKAILALWKYNKPNFIYTRDHRKRIETLFNKLLNIFKAQDYIYLINNFELCFFEILKVENKKELYRAEISFFADNQKEEYQIKKALDTFKAQNPSLKVTATNKWLIIDNI